VRQIVILNGSNTLHIQLENSFEWDSHPRSHNHSLLIRSSSQDLVTLSKLFDMARGVFLEKRYLA